jgi:hypothetical protein
MAAVKNVTGIHMKRERVQRNQEAVAAFDDEFEAVSEDITAAFVWNMDESGCSVWADKQGEYRVRVPDSYEGDWTCVPFDRHSKRSTLVGCISADGSAMRA